MNACYADVMYPCNEKFFACLTKDEKRCAYFSPSEFTVNSHFCGNSGWVCKHRKPNSRACCCPEANAEAAVVEKLEAL